MIWYSSAFLIAHYNYLKPIDFNVFPFLHDYLDSQALGSGTNCFMQYNCTFFPDHNSHLNQ